MAIIKLGTLVTGIRGTAGGATFSANKSGPYVKAWARPPSPTAVPQNAQQVTFAQLVTGWAALSDVQRDDWDDWALNDAPARTNSLGETILLSGFNWYISVNTLLLAVDKVVRATPPTVAPPAAPTIDSFNPRETGVGAVGVGYPANEFSGFFFWARVAMANRQASTSFNRPNYKFTFDNTPGTNSVNLTSQFLAHYGEVQDGRRWFLRAYRMTTQGLLSAATDIFNDTVT